MRTNTVKNTVYLSDFFSVPMPAHASSHQEYLRKIRNRRIVWALLPYCIEAACLLLLLCLTVAGLSIFVLSLGG